MSQQSMLQAMTALLGQAFNENVTLKINPNNAIDLKFDPASNPSNQANSPQQQTGQALQAASKAATPPSLEGIFDPNMIKMLMGNQVGVQDALQVPQALSNMGYQQALTQQADRGPQELIMKLAGDVLQQRMRGSQALTTKQAVEGTGALQAKQQAPFVQEQIAASQQKRDQSEQMFGTTWAKEYAGLENLWADTALKEAKASTEGTGADKAVEWAKLRAKLDENESKDLQMTLANGGKNSGLVTAYYARYPKSTVAPVVVKGFVSDSVDVVDLGENTIQDLKAALLTDPEFQGMTLNDALLNIRKSQTGD